MKKLILVAEAFIILAAWASFAAVSLTSPATPITMFYKGVGLAPLAVPAVYAIEAWYDRLDLQRLSDATSSRAEA